MQCKREQMGKSCVGKGFGGPQRREIWLLSVSHTNLQLPPALPHDTLAWNQPMVLGGAGWLQEGSAMKEQSLYLCFLENTNKEQSSSTANKGEINPEASRENSELYPKFPNVNWESALSCLFISACLAFFTVTLRASLCLGMLPPERHASSHAWCGLPTSICLCLHACMHSLNISRARQLIWFQLAGLSGTSCDSSGSYLLWAWGPSSIKTANMTYCWGCLYSR